MFFPSPLMDATGQTQPQDSLGRHLLLPVPVGAARFGSAHPVFISGLFFLFFDGEGAQE